MKIAISAAGPSLDAEVDPRFGRCQYFIFVDTDTMKFEAVENKSQMASGGAGIASAQSVVDKGVEAVLTGHCGPNAFQVLEANRVKIITGASGKVKDAIAKFKSGQLKSDSSPSVSAHFGMGRGMGKSPKIDREQPTSSIEQDIGELKNQSQMLRQQLNEVMFRLNQLENRTK